MRNRLLLTAIILVLAAPAWAGSLDLHRVAAKAQWVAHVDVDALWASQAAQQFLEPLLATDRAKIDLAKLHKVAGFDLRHGLHGVTLYGDEFKPRRGTIILDANVDEASVEKFLAREPDFSKSKYRGHTVYSWSDRHHAGQTVRACILVQHQSARSASSADGDGLSGGGPSLVVLSNRADDIERAIDVLDGKAPNLGEAKSLLTEEIRKTAPGKTVIVTVGAAGLGEADLPLKSPVVRQCDVLNLAMGEQGADVFVAGRLVAKSEKSATEMEQALQGLLALGRLASDSDKDLQRILETVKLTVDGHTVSLQWHGQVADVIRFVQQQHMKKQQKAK